MPRKKNESEALTKANARKKGIETFEKNFDLGNGITQLAYEAHITALDKKFDEYNTAITLLNTLSNELTSKEKEVNNYSSLVLKAVATKYGEDSNEYEMAGGVKKSEHKKRKPKAPVVKS